MRLWISMFLVWGISASSSFADNQYPNGTMTIGALQAPPYAFVDENNNPTGILVVKIRHALSQMGIRADFRISNWARSFRDATEGRIDAVIPALKTPERQIHLIYPDEPLATFNMVMVGNPNAPLAQPGIKALEGKHVGRIRNAKVTPIFDKAVQEHKFKLEERTSFRQLALGVAYQRMDFAVGPELMLLWAAGESGILNKVRTIEPALGREHVYLAISKQSKFATHAADISKNLHAISESPEFELALEPYSQFLHINLFQKLRDTTGIH